jgi:hypothetical protein
VRPAAADAARPPSSVVRANDRIEIRLRAGRGRAAFAGAATAPASLIESAPVVIAPAAECTITILTGTASRAASGAVSCRSGFRAEEPLRSGAATRLL